MDSFSFAGTIGVMETLIVQGRIRRQGVSNLDYDDAQVLWQIPDGRECTTSQALYHLTSRDIEYGLLPWCQRQQMPVMAYDPLTQAGRLRGDLLFGSVASDIVRAHSVSVTQILLARVIH